MKLPFLLLPALLLAQSTFAQLSISSTHTPYIVDFEAPGLPGVTNGVYRGMGFQPEPVSGELDSNAWASTVWTDGTLDFDGTQNVSATDFARGLISAPAGTDSVGGFYALQYLDSRMMYIQQGSTGDFGPGSLTLKIRNDSGTTLTGINVSFDRWLHNYGDRAGTYVFSWDKTGANTTGAFGNILNTVSTAGTANGSFTYTPFATTTINTTLNPGEHLYLRWSGTVSGSGLHRDGFALDNISVTGIPEPSAALLVGLAMMTGLGWRRRRP